MVRVRFAPSPTGPLHIGGVRTALFNYLFARKHGGTFILRVEDTDRARYIPHAEAYIFEALSWCGISPDESVQKPGEYGPYRQSERTDIYRQYIDRLVDDGYAYYAFDTTEELEAQRAKVKNFAYNAMNRDQFTNSLTLSANDVKQRIERGEKYVIRFKVPENKDVVVEDIVRGTVRFHSSVIDDKVLFKADGFPTYHFANVIDDHLMKISHVIRGEEWLPSLPFHALLYEAFGWEKPHFAHLPLILKPQGKGKLSKRDGEKIGIPVFPMEWMSEGEKLKGYKEEGYLPHAVINMLALLGWSPTESNQELFTLDELVEAFTLEQVQKGGAKFDPEKIKWLNQQYIQTLTDEDLYQHLQPVIDNHLPTIPKEKVMKVVGMIKERITLFDDFLPQASYFFQQPQVFNPKGVKKAWKEDSSVLLERLCKEVFETLAPSDIERVEEMTKNWISEQEVGLGKVLNALRLSLVGNIEGVHLFDIITFIGLKETSARVRNAIHVLS